MTPEQKSAITACVEAFHIPRDCMGFRLVIETSDRFALAYGDPKYICAALEVDHAPSRVSEV